MKNNPKILFVIPKVKSMYGNDIAPPLYPHVGIAYLSSFLVSKGYQVRVFDEGVETNHQKLYSLIDNFKPDIIGVTGFSYASVFMDKLIKNIQKYTSIPIIAGGPHASAVREQIIQSTGVNFAIIGEAEDTFFKFLKEFIQKKPDYSQVPGLIWKNKNQIVLNPKNKYLIDLDQLPFPDFDVFDLSRYGCFKENTIPIITSRGCPYGCNYCSVRLSMGQCFRPRSADNVFKEIKYWHKKGYHTFDINDDCFTLDLKRAKDICDLIINHHLKIKFQLYNGIRVDRVDRELLFKLKQAGCFFIAYGCESGSQKVIDTIGKNIRLDQVRQTIDWTNTAGIKNAVNFIIGHQDESYADAKETLIFAQSLPTNFVNFYNLVPYPGTPVYDWAIKNAKFLVPFKTYLQNISYRDNTPIFETTKFTKTQRHDIMKIGFNLYEKKLFQFRFGRNLGYFFYLITRIKPISDISHSLISRSQLLVKIFQKLTAKSRQ